MYHFLHRLFAWLLTALYKVEVHGLEHFRHAGKRVLIVANHTSFLDAMLRLLFLPERLTFAIDTEQVKRWYGRLASLLIDLLPVNPLSPLSTKSLIKLLRKDHKGVIWPEGRITDTGSLMKIYQGAGLIANKSEASVLPIRIDGAQYTPLSRLRGQVRVRWRPTITLTVLPPRRIVVAPEITGRARRDRAGRMLTDLVTELIFATSTRPHTLFQALLDARRIHGGNHLIVEDVERKPRTSNQLLQMCYALGPRMARDAAPGDAVGLLLPSAIVTVAAYSGLQLFRRVPAMLNFTLGVQTVESAIKTAAIRTVYISRRFVEHAKFDSIIADMEWHVTVRYLEDLRDSLSPVEKNYGVACHTIIADDLPAHPTGAKRACVVGRKPPHTGSTVFFLRGRYASGCCPCPSPCAIGWPPSHSA
jgi:acyl-[acyl-carrier-protein]-phospholipid O-acyltransferase/long-chain-fatty-acid--[acyl-carrier-protein] ligase